MSSNERIYLFRSTHVSEKHLCTFRKPENNKYLRLNEAVIKKKVYVAARSFRKHFQVIFTEY